MLIHIDPRNLGEHVLVRVRGDILLTVEPAHLQFLTGIFPDLRLLTPFGDEWRIDPRSGDIIPEYN